MRGRRWLLGVLSLWAGWACADEVVLTNGDRLTGQVVSASEGKLKFKTEAAGEIDIDLSRVRTFSTDEPIQLRLEDGTALDQRVAASDAEGAIDVDGRAVGIAEIAQINPPPVRWTGSLVASGLLTRGNSETTSFSLMFDASRRTEDDRTSVNAGYLFAEQEDPDTGEDETSTDNWFVQGKYDYFLSEKLYVFGLLRVERDRIANLDLRLAPSAGLGYQWVERELFNLSTEAGLGWVYEEYDPGDSEDHISARLAYHVDRRINDRVSVFHIVEYLPSVEDISDFNIIADAGLRAELTDDFFAEFKTEWRHDSTPAPGSVENDLRYILGVGWTF